MQIDPVYSSVQSALGKENTHNTIGYNGNNGLYLPNMSSMDLETALKMVQEQRVQIMENTLEQQIKAIQSRNEEIANLNDLLYQLNRLNAYFARDAKASTPVPDAANPLVEEINQSIVNLGLNHQHASEWTPFINKKIVKSDVENAIDRVKGMVDSSSNSQQMDMLRLQSMSNKRNEAFDVMTNFIKKMQDSRSSIIGNMR
ncbi:hypothetical protein [Paenibacillus sp. J2TS4]|uniref:hypothetical protein n=1 Tax=Paenibacillus sp. J2TS4 TaxID=2807194 RepID=UPI0020C16412|nr:hypothetical protein [Paenibacillus sp. J2TS4]